jgi:DNA polymerase III sliding clamp (beta) subunit (PCNA family)
MTRVKLDSKPGTVTLPRQDFLSRLELVEPALSDNSALPILSNIVFNKTSVLAYNDLIAIEVPFDTGIVGAVDGKLLINLLKASRAKTVDLLVDDGCLTIKAATAKLKLPVLDEKSFVFKMPEPRGASRILFVEKIAGPVEHCLRSISKDAAIVEQSGVTMVFDKQGIGLYSTNAQSLSLANVNMTGNTDLRIALPAPFCKQLLGLAIDGAKLHVCKDYVLMTAGNAKLFSRLILVDQGKEINYQKVIDSNIPKGMKPALRPKTLDLVVKRAEVVAGKEGRTTITVEHGKMKFYTASGGGEVVDYLEADKAQPDVAISVQPRYLADTNDFKFMTVINSCVIFADDNNRNIYMAASSSVKS